MGQILWQGFDWLKIIFWSKQWNGTNITENIFAPWNEPQTAKLWFSLFLKTFSPEIYKNISLRTEKWLSPKESEDYSEIYFFSTSLKMNKSLGKFLIWWNIFLGSNPWNRTNTTENISAPQNEPHTDKQDFWCFEAFLPEIDKKLLFKVLKCD